MRSVEQLALDQTRTRKNAAFSSSEEEVGSAPRALDVWMIPWQRPLRWLLMLLKRAPRALEGSPSERQHLLRVGHENSAGCRSVGVYCDVGLRFPN